MTAIGTSVYVYGRRVAGGDAPLDTIQTARAQGGMAWIGLLRPDADELREVAGALGLHPLAVEDSLKGHQRSKLERYGDMTFIVLQPARYVDESETVEFSEVDLFVGADFIVTVQDDDLVDAHDVRTRLEEHPEILSKGPFSIVWAVLETVVHAYRPVLDGVENDIDEIEDQLFSDGPHVSQRIFGLQREVIDLFHATSPLPDMLERLQGIVAEVTGMRDAPAIREVHDRASHVNDKVSGFKHTLDNALTVHATLVDQQSNEEMRRMTEYGLQQNEQVKKVSGWAAILFAPTLVGTIYGMNFDNMPELHWTFGYPLALVAMLATSVTLYTVFKKKDWL